MTARNISRMCILLFKAPALAAIATIICACAQNLATNSATEQAGNIQILQHAEREDLTRANSPNVDPSARVDLYSQAQKAGMAAARLEHGYPVAQSEVSRAAQVPDEQLSEQQRLRLIQKLTNAKALADRGASDHDDDPILTEDFVQQGRMIDGVIANLEIGREVPRDELEAALESPAFP